jgi:release factor glutamine methyltransferase
MRYARTEKLKKNIELWPNEEQSAASMIMSASALFFTLFNFSAKNVNFSKGFLFQYPFHDFSLRRNRTVINGLGFPSVRTKTKLSYYYISSRIGSSILDSRSRPYYLRKFVIHSSSSSGGTRNLLSATSSTYSYENEAVYNVLQQSVDILQGNNVPEPTLSSCHLLSCALNLPSSNGFSYLLQILEQADAGNTINNNQHLAQRRLTQEEARKFQQMLQRRFHHEPIQYIIGEWDFYDFTLKCRAPILCPRPETEELVEWVSQSIIRFQNQHTKNPVDEAPPTPSRKLRILDVGCGTGAIGLALARLLPESDVVAIDTSQDAVNLSMENYASLKIDNSSPMRYQAICCSAKDFTNRRMIDDRGENAHFYFEFDVVVSNPPYIPAADMLTLTRDVIQYESYEALYGGSNDGMGVIRDIIERMPEWTKNSQLGMRELFMEVDTSHPPKIAKWLNRSRNDISSSTLPAFFVESRKDFYGKDRFVRLQANRHFLH